VNSFLPLHQQAKRHKNQLKIDSLFYYLKACNRSLRPVTLSVYSIIVERGIGKI
jgi:hypothetical protein